MSHASYTMQHKDSTAFLHGIPTYRKAHRQVVYWPCWTSAMDPPARHGEILTQSVRRGAAVGASVGGAVVAVPGAVAGGVPGGSFPGLFCSDQFPCSADLQ